MKDSFILYLEQKEIFNVLTDKEAGKLIKAIFEYQNTNEVPELDKSLQLAFVPIRQALDRNSEKWEDIKQKRSVAGKKSAENKKQQKTTNSTSVDFVKNKTTNSTVYVNDNVNVNVNVNDNADVINYYEQNIGLLNPASAELILSYFDDFPKDMIIQAIKLASQKNKKSASYINGILKSWKNKGYKVLADVEMEQVKEAKDIPKSDKLLELYEN